MEHVDWIPRKWARGTQGMTAEQKGVYFDVVNQIYLLGEAIPEDHTWLCGLCGVSARRLRRILDELVEAGKIERINPELSDANFTGIASDRQKNGRSITLIMANHCAEELEMCEMRMQRSKKNGKLGGRNAKNQQVTEPGGFSTPLTQGFGNKTQLNKYPPKSSDPRVSGEAEPEPSAQARSDDTEPIQTALVDDETTTDDPPPEVQAGDAPPLPSEPPGSPPKLAADGKPYPPPGRRADGTNPRATGTSLHERGVNPRAVGTNRRSRPPPAIPPSPAPTGPPEVVAMFEALRAEIGEAAFRAWIAPLEVGAVNGAVTLHAPSRFHRDHVDGHWGDRMRTIIGCLVEIDVAAADGRR